MRRSPIIYNDEELNWLSANRTLSISDCYDQFFMKFNRNDVLAKDLHSLRKRKRWKTGRSGKFEKGHSPNPNSGLNGPNKTSFKKGNIPANLKPLYSERTRNDGYIEIKVPEINPHTGAKTRYRLKHQWLWERHHGAVPGGHILHFIDGDRANSSIENLETFPRGVGAIMNKQKYSSLPSEIKPVVKTLAKLQYRQHELQQEI